MKDIAEIKVITDEVVRRIETKTLFMCSIGHRGTVLIYNSRSNREVVGSVYFFDDMATVYGRSVKARDTFYTEEAIGSAGYSDPDFFEKIINVVKGL